MYLFCDVWMSSDHTLFLSPSPATPTGRRSTKNRQNAEIVEFTVGVLGSGQVFGELAVLDTEVPSPVTAISSTAVELYCFDINTMAHVHW
jgi:hypothetical protein